MKTFCRFFLGIAIIATLSGAITCRVWAQNSPKDYILPVQAKIQTNPASIILQWPHDANAQHFYISRRLLGDVGNWAALVTLPGADSSYADTKAQVGTLYEYRVIDSTKNDSIYAVFGFLASGMSVPSSPQPGAVDLMVDNTYATPLKTEIDQLITDLTAEGWLVLRHDVARTDSVPYIQDTIENDFNNYENLRTVFLLGHVPVPYSGDIAPDGHVPGKGNHQGAWPADVYYGNFETNWTDFTVDDTTAYDPRNKNVPGDGKFDQGYIQYPMDLEVGRVDLFDMPTTSPLSDTILMKNYLDRDHAFRTGQFTAPARALIDDNFGCIGEGSDDIQEFNGKLDTIPYVFPLDYDAPATNGWRNFPGLVGRNNIDDFHLIQSDTFHAASDWFGYIDTAISP